MCTFFLTFLRLFQNPKTWLFTFFWVVAHVSPNRVGNHTQSIERYHFQWPLSWPVAVRIRSTEATDRCIAFICNTICTISTRQKIRNSVRARSSSHAALLPRYAFTHLPEFVSFRPTACRFYPKPGCLRDVSHIVHLRMWTVTYATTVNHSRSSAHQTLHTHNYTHSISSAPITGRSWVHYK